MWKIFFTYSADFWDQFTYFRISTYFPHISTNSNENFSKIPKIEGNVQTFTDFRQMTCPYLNFLMYCQQKKWCSKPMNFIIAQKSTHYTITYLYKSEITNLSNLSASNTVSVQYLFTCLRARVLSAKQNSFLWRARSASCSVSETPVFRLIQRK